MNIEYKERVLPVFEAAQYLKNRFTKHRLNDVIDGFQMIPAIMNSGDWTFYKAVGDIERELDDMLEPDELMRRYFEPIQTNEAMPENNDLTVGGMLLVLPDIPKEDVSYDDIIDFYRNSSSEAIVGHLFRSSLAPFFVNEDEGCESMAQFMEAVDRSVTKLDDKWLLIDAAINPVKHLERIRPLVSSAADHISKRSEDFKTLFDTVREDFLKEPSVSRLGISLEPAEGMKVVIYPSIFQFFGTNFTSSEENGVRLIVGVFVLKGLEIRGKIADSRVYTSLLKLLSDPTRFEVLHEMCDKMTFGMELAEKFGCTRSAMYYHLERLASLGLAELQMSDYRMLYTMNKQNVYDKLNAMRDYLLNGWKPE